MMGVYTLLGVILTGLVNMNKEYLAPIDDFLALGFTAAAMKLAMRLESTIKNNSMCDTDVEMGTRSL